MIFDAKIAQRADGKITPTQNFCTRFTDFLKEAGVGGNVDTFNRLKQHQQRQLSLSFTFNDDSHVISAKIY